MINHLTASTPGFAERLASAQAAAQSQGTVLFFLPGLTAGGSEHVVTFNANRLVANGYDVIIASCEAEGSTPYYPCDPRVAVRYLGVPVSKQGKLQGVSSIIGRVAGLRRVLREKRPDLVISFLTRTNVIAVLAARGLGIPVIVSERNNPQRQTVNRVWDSLRKFTYARAYGLVTMTRGALAFFPENMRKRGWVIPNMADWQHVKPLYQNKDRVLTAVGRLTDQKGFDLLIDAFAAVAPQHPEWRLRIWGEGTLRPQLEKQVAALGLKDRIELPGVSPSPGSWIETADAFVLSSRYEGWGLVLGEAMAAGLPCVSFDCPFGPADMITNRVDGILAPDGDAAALARSLSEIMGDNDLRKRLGANAAGAALRFAPEQIGEQWENLIASVIADTRNRSFA
jgi:glycosyltransferase involved in cell wall biosynthesis